MKSKNLGILVAVLAVLIVIYLIQQFSSGKKSVSESLIQLYPDFNSSSVNFIKVYKQDYPDSGLSFVKKDGKWQVASYFYAPAKENDIDKLLTDVKSMQGEIRSTKADLFEDYDIADDAALHLEFQGPDSAIIAHFLVGKGVQQSSRSSFVRNYNADTVYMANQNFLSRFAVWNAEPSKKMPDKRWADMVMTHVDKEQIQSIEIKAKRKTYLFTKNEEPSEDTLAPPKYVWKQVTPKKGKVLEDKDIQSILGRITGLNASDIVSRESNPEYGLTKPEYTVNVITGEGQATKINFGIEADTTSKAHYAMVEGQPFIYNVANYHFEAMFVNPFKTE